MSRKRYISTNLSVDPRVRDLAKRDEFAALLYTWMIPHADDSGCVSADPDTLLMQVVPGFRWRTAQNVAEAVEAMVELGLVERDGDYLRFPSKSFYKYQTYVGADRRSNGHEPEPPGSGADSRKTAQNSAARESAAEPTQNRASFTSSVSSSSSVLSSRVTPSAAYAASPPAPPPFSEEQQRTIDEVTTTLGPFGFRASVELWRKVFEQYGELPLEMEALKQADWLRTHRKRFASVTRYTNWLDNALKDFRQRHPETAASEPVSYPEAEPLPEGVCCWHSLKTNGQIHFYGCEGVA